MIDFGLQLGGSRGVRRGSVGRLFGLLKLPWSQDEPKSPPRSPRVPPRGLLGPPRPLQEASWERFYTILASNLVVFRAKLSRFRPPTCWISQPTNHLSNKLTNQPTTYPTNQPIKQPNNQTTKQPNNQTTKQPDNQTSLHP